MPRYNNVKHPGPGRFDRLPRKLQIFLLMLVMLAAAAVQFLMGLHSVHTGKPIILRNPLTALPSLPPPLP